MFKRKSLLYINIVFFLVVVMMREEEFSSSLNNNATFLGFTALHYAALVDNIEIARILIKYGGNPTLQNDLGHTPIMYADGEMKPYLEKEMSAVCFLIRKVFISFIV